MNRHTHAHTHGTTTVMIIRVNLSKPHTYHIAGQNPLCIYIYIYNMGCGSSGNHMLKGVYEVLIG